MHHKRFIDLKMCLLSLSMLLLVGTHVSFGAAMSDDAYELPAACDFAGLINNSLAANQCSPRLLGEAKSKFTGLLINSAVEIIWPKSFEDGQVFVSPDGDSSSSFNWMVSGLAQLPKNTLALSGDFSRAIEVVAINKCTGKRYSGKVMLSGYKSPRPPTHTETQEDRAANSRSYFTIDLVKNLNIPRENATYSLYAALGSYKSNILTIATKVN